MMSDAIKSFAEQFAYNPIIEGGKIKKYTKYILSGMGGSHLAADLARIYDHSLPIIIRSDYGLPSQLSDKELKNTLFIASSYSGNTEEVIDALKIALKKHMPSVVIAVGGELIKLAKKYKLPYIQLPNTGIQPRSAMGFSLKALFKVLGDEKALKDCTALAKKLNPAGLEEVGKILAQELKDCIPVIYSSRANKAIAYNWKIKLNETGKIPAFYNIFPELNHNEMTGFDVTPSSKHLSQNFYFLILRDDSDNKKILKRMDTLAQLYKDRGLKVKMIEMSEKNKLEKIFNYLLLADWTAVHIANLYGLESEQVPMVEEFKKLIS